MKPLERLLREADTEDTHIKCAAIIDARDELKQVRELETAANALLQIVEGVRNERWVSPSGFRLKDTKEWCAFYCALKRNQPTAPDAQKGGGE